MNRQQEFAEGSVSETGGRERTKPLDMSSSTWDTRVRLTLVGIVDLLFLELRSEANRRSCT